MEVVIRNSVLAGHEQLIRWNVEVSVGVLGHNTETERIPVHEALVVLVRVREVLKVEFFMWQHCTCMCLSVNYTSKFWACIPLRFFFCALAGIGIGPTSSSLSSSFVFSVGAGPSIWTMPLCSSSRSRFPRTEMSSTPLDMVDKASQIKASPSHYHKSRDNSILSLHNHTILVRFLCTLCLL